MPEIDRFALHKLQELIEKGRKAYDAYEFHVIYHALFNYCTLDLSAFYLDILKDRLYTSPPQSVERKSAQTVLHMILDAIARLMAPILPFTSDEIWQYMPTRRGKESNIHLSLLPEVKCRLQRRCSGGPLGIYAENSRRGNQSAGGGARPKTHRTSAGRGGYDFGNRGCI